MSKKEKIVDAIREAMEKFKSIVISGEVGVGKITNTIEALQDAKDIYYIGNPVDYIGKPRQKGYDKYIHYIMSLKKDMHIIADEKEILSFDFSSLSGKEAILLIDEIYGRSPEQYEKMASILDTEGVKVILVTGCLKNVGRIIQKIEAGLMLTNEGILMIDKEFAVKMCGILSSDPFEKQPELFH